MPSKYFSLELRPEDTNDAIVAHIADRLRELIQDTYMAMKLNHDMRLVGAAADGDGRITYNHDDTPIFIFELTQARVVAPKLQFSKFLQLLVNIRYFDESGRVVAENEIAPETPPMPPLSKASLVEQIPAPAADELIAAIRLIDLASTFVDIKE